MSSCESALNISDSVFDFYEYGCISSDEEKVPNKAHF